MTLHETAPHASAAVAALALAARAAGAITWDGAAAGLVIGLAVAAAFGAPGLLVLGTFFIGGSLATRLGYARKALRGAAEARGGARDARRVVGKGGVAAAIAVAALVGPRFGIAFAGAVAAALADTLGTELGALARGTPRLLPSLRKVPHGTPGAVSFAGTAAGAAGAALVAGAALLGGEGLGAPGVVPQELDAAAAVAAGGLLGALLESVLVGAAPALRLVPGWIRNLVPTAAGAAAAHALALAVRGDAA